MVMPIEEILIYSLILSLVISIIYRVLVNPEEVRRVKEEVKSYREKMNKAKKSGDKAEMEKFMSEMLKANSKQLKFTMKPMLASMIIFIIFLGWLTNTYADAVITSPIPVPFIGYELNWFWWYMVITIPATMLFRKLLGVE